MQYQVEDRLFRKGVSDEEVQLAMDLIHEYLLDHAADAVSDLQWWEEFESFFVELTRALSPSQLEAVEIAVDSMLSHAGASTWSLARLGLTVARKGVADPDQASVD